MESPVFDSAPAVLSSNLPAILLMGPTASGKTAAALALAQHFPLGIISVDSALVYRDMNIGTAKPDAATLAQYPHALIDLCTPEESYSVARFCDDARQAMNAVRAQGKIPLLVGGTMLYYRALLQGLATLPAGHAALRATIDAEAAQHGWPALHAALARHDPQTAARLHPTDAQRIQRALEIFRLTGKPLSSWLAEQHTAPSTQNVLPLALLPTDRTKLHQQIAERFKQMLVAGLIDEVNALRQHYRLHAQLPSMRCVGYRQVWQMQTGEIPAAQLEERGIYATRQLAKRQMTWLRNSFASETFDSLDPQLLPKLKTRIAIFLETV